MEEQIEENLEMTDKDKETNKRSGFGLGLGLGLMIGAMAVLVISLVFSQKVARLQVYESEILDNDAKLRVKTIQDFINNYYYNYTDEEVTVQDMRDNMYKGIVNSLGDKYSAYYTAEEMREVSEDTQGIYYGIGAYISFDDEINYPIIARPMPNTPAEEAGLREGDIIAFVDDVSAYGMSVDEVVSLVKGEAGTDVHLTLVRENEEDYLEVDITRAPIESRSVSSAMLEDDIAYIRISTFETPTISQFAEAYQEARDNNAKGLILDLRSNGGGLVTSVVEISRQILPEGVIFYEMDKKGNRKDYLSNGETPIDIPMVVLVNSYSASAAEILTGALKDYKLATIVGTNTFGKGVVQDTRILSDGSAIKLTGSAYFSPNGLNIQGTGIAPDIEVQFDGEAYYEKGIDNQLEKAIETLKAIW